jgi:hypothetical protein
LSGSRAPAHKWIGGARENDSTKDFTDDPHDKALIGIRSADNPPTPIKCANSYEKPQRWYSGWKIPKFLVNLLTLLAVGWYAFLTQRQLSTTKEHFRTDERAWVGIEVSRPTVRARANDKFPASFTYEVNARNTGKTVARCVEIRSERQAGLGSLAMTENKEIIDNWQDKYLLGKFQNSTPESVIIRSASKALGPGQVTPIPVTFAGQGPRNNFGSMFVGRVDYIDEFSVRHWVKFCFFIADRDGNLWYCKYGNDEDRNLETPPTTEPTCPIE